MQPKVSILIPTYNREHILRETIQCALDQDYSHFEVVICDNASTDKSWEIISEFKQRYGNIKVQRNPENLGAVRNWVECIKLADGEFAKILWSDDLMAKNCISRMVSCFNDHVGFVYTATELFETIPGEGIKYYKLGNSGEYASSIFIEGKLGGEDFPSSPGCAMFRLKDLRENLLTHIPVPKEINLTSKAVGNDLLIFLLTARKYPRFAYIQDVLNFFRVHKTSISVSSKRGELTFMYQLAETFFVEKYEISGQAFRKFNSKLFLSTIFFRHSLGITHIQEFYALKEIRLTNVSLRHILFLLVLFMKRTIFKVR